MYLAAVSVKISSVSCPPKTYIWLSIATEECPSRSNRIGANSRNCLVFNDMHSTCAGESIAIIRIKIMWWRNRCYHLIWPSATIQLNRTTLLEFTDSTTRIHTKITRIVGSKKKPQLNSHSWRCYVNLNTKIVRSRIIPRMALMYFFKWFRRFAWARCWTDSSSFKR